MNGCHIFQSITLIHLPKTSKLQFVFAFVSPGFIYMLVWSCLFRVWGKHGGWGWGHSLIHTVSGTSSEMCYQGSPCLFSFIASDFNILIELSFSFFPVGGRGFTQAFIKAFLYTREIIRLNSESFQWRQKTSKHRYFTYQNWKYFIF